MHAEVPVIDLHADTAKLMDKVGYDLHARHDRPLPRFANYLGHVDIPRLRDGGMAAQFFAFWTWPNRVPGAERSMTRSVLNQLDALDAAMAAHPEHLAWVRTGAEIRAAKAAGRLPRSAGSRAATALEGKVEHIEMFARRGVRYLGPLHSVAERARRHLAQAQRDDGLTPLGRDVIARVRAVRRDRRSRAHQPARVLRGARHDDRARDGHAHRRRGRPRALAQPRRRADPRGRRSAAAASASSSRASSSAARRSSPSSITSST